MMNISKVEKSTFLQIGRKEVVTFSAAPQVFSSDEAAIDALDQAVKYYQLTCGRGYVEFRSADNPFIAIIIHGINA